MKFRLSACSFLVLAFMAAPVFAGGGDIASAALDQQSAEAASSSGVDYQRNAWGVQSSIATNGTIAVGPVNYGAHHSLGVLGGANVSEQGDGDSVFSLVVFGGGRYLLRPQTYFAYGVDFAANFGKKDDETLKDSYFVGPYVSLEYYLSTHVVLTAFVNPYGYSYERKGDDTDEDHHIFSTGGLGLAYLF